MTEEEKKWNKKDKPTYIMVPRNLVIAIILAFVSLVIGNVMAVQWANFVDKRSNQRWCGMVTMFDNAYSATPPTTELGHKVALEFKKLRTEFNCR